MSITSGLTGAAQGASAGAALGPVGALVGGGLGALAGIFGGGKKEPTEQEKAYADLLAQLKATGIPDVEAQQVALEQLKSAGQLTPELEQTITQQQSSLANYQNDPQLMQAQRAAIARLKNIGDQGGLQLEDRAALNDITNQAAQAAKGREGAILQNMAERGMGGSGNELAARLQSSQDAANRASSQGLQVGADAQRRALEAVLQGGQLAGQTRQQDFSQAAQQASAQDTINRFNAANAQQVSGANVNRSNSAQQQNLANAQRIADTNTQLANEQQVYNKGLLQQQYNNQLGKINAASNLTSGKNAATTQANANYSSGLANTLAGLGGLARQGIKAYKDYNNPSSKSTETNSEDEET